MLLLPNITHSHISKVHWLSSFIAARYCYCYKVIRLECQHRVTWLKNASMKNGNLMHWLRIKYVNACALILAYVPTIEVNEASSRWFRMQNIHKVVMLVTFALCLSSKSINNLFDSPLSVIPILICRIACIICWLRCAGPGILMDWVCRTSDMKSSWWHANIRGRSLKWSWRLRCVRILCKSIVICQQLKQRALAEAANNINLWQQLVSQQVVNSMMRLINHNQLLHARFMFPFLRTYTVFTISRARAPYSPFPNHHRFVQFTFLLFAYV